MDDVLFFIFGMLDAFAILALIFKSFRWPFWQSLNRIFVLSIIISAVSYLDRFVFEIEAWDPLIQLVVYSLAVQYIIRVSPFYASSVLIYGYVYFLLVQAIVYKSLLLSGIVTDADAAADTGVGTYIIQVTNDIVCLAIAGLMYIFGRGFTYIDSPPHHDFMTVHRGKIDFAVNLFSSAVIATYMYWIINFSAHLYIIIPSLAVAMAAIILVTRRKEFRH